VTLSEIKSVCVLIDKCYSVEMYTEAMCNVTEYCAYHFVPMNILSVCYLVYGSQLLVTFPFFSLKKQFWQEQISGSGEHRAIQR